MIKDEIVRRVFRGYAGVFRALAQIVGVLACLAFLALSISYPIWWLATNRRSLFTLLVLGACSAGAAGFWIRRLASRGRSREERKRPSRLAGIVMRALFVLGAYGTAILLEKSLIIGIAASILLLALIGLWEFGRDSFPRKGR